MKRFLLFLLVALGLSARAQAQTPTLSIADATTLEGNSRFRELLFPVTLSRAQTFDVSASYITKPITAQPNSDYTPQLGGQIVIKAGQTKANIIVRVVGDTTEEAHESFLVQLGAPKRATITDSDGIGSVTDDDYNGQISINDTSFTELNSGVKVAKLLVSFSSAPLHDVSVTYETKDEGAKAPGDYTTTKGTLIFKPGRLVFTVAVPIVGDTLVEGNERCFVRISAAGIPIAKSLGYITIVNDDGVTPPPASGKIVFSSSRDGEEEIYIMNADGSNQTRLTNNVFHDSYPVLSPDGNKIVFESERGGFALIFVMNADGSNPVQITPNVGTSYDPEFSGDGSKIVFAFSPNLQSEQDDSESEIYTMNADGSNRVRVTNDDFADGQPAFSPDGSKIVFSSLRDGSGFPQIHVMNSNGSGITRLTQGGEAFDAKFSPDGSKIVYASAPTPERVDIFVMNADGSNQVRLPGSGLGEGSAQPCFSPNGTAIAFASDRSGSPQIYVMNANGTNQTRLTSLGENVTPSWSIGSVPAATFAASQKAPAALPNPSAGNS